jgi:DNA-binding PadR family transcriptional regulator
MARNTDLPRLSGREQNVLEQLVAREKYGLELVADSDGTLARNAIYVLLARMEDKGLITGREESAPDGAKGPPRRRYRITGHGSRVLAAYEVALASLRGIR